MRPRKNCLRLWTCLAVAAILFAAPSQVLHAQRVDRAQNENRRTVGGLRHVGTTKHPGLLGAVTVALSPDGQFLYAQGFQANAVNTFRRNAATGTLTHVQTLADPRIAGAVKLRLSPDGKLAVAACFAAKSIGLFSREAKTGELELIATWHEQPELSLEWPTDAIFSTDGKFVYAVDDQKSAL